MNDAIVKSYFRSVQRGTRTMEHVPEELREAVAEAVRLAEEKDKTKEA